MEAGLAGGWDGRGVELKKMNDDCNYPSGGHYHTLSMLRLVQVTPPIEPWGGALFLSFGLNLELQWVPSP